MMRPRVLTTPTPLMPFSAISASAATAGVSGVTDTTVCAAQPSACTVVSASAPSRCRCSNRNLCARPLRLLGPCRRVSIRTQRAQRLAVKVGHARHSERRGPMAGTWRCRSG